MAVNDREHYEFPDRPELPRDELPPIPEALMAQQLDMMRNSELQLNLDNPFERVIAEMVRLQRIKADDYADEDDTLKNMRFVVDFIKIPQYTVVEDCNVMVLRKTARIINLRGRSASNESVLDSYIDRAVYAVLAVVAAMEEHEAATSEM